MNQQIELTPEVYPMLSEAIVEVHYQRNPQLSKIYGPEGRQKCLDDAVIHLTYLQQALDNDSEQLFIDYVLWAKTLFEGINIPLSHLVEHLEIMSEVLRLQLTQTSAGKVGEILTKAGQQLDQESQSNDSFLDEHAPFYDLARQYLDLLLASNRSKAGQLILSAVKDQNISVQDIYLNVFQPCQREVGLLWQTGRISVAQEHFCTAATQLCMSQLYPFIFDSEKNGKIAVITCAQGELHEVGVRMVADLLEMNGWDAFYLGANVPIDSVLEFVKDKQPDMIGISATITSNLPQVKGLISKIRAVEIRHSCIMVGGYPFNISPDLYKEIGADAHSTDAKIAIEMANKLAAKAD
jgi:MerR family transcriptional regulator, light-induced transcriptional regulator